MTARIAPIAALVVVFCLVPAALAAKGGGGGKPSGGSGDSITLASQVGAATAAPTYGSDATFTITTSSSDRFANLQCFQNGALVLNGWSGPVGTSWSVPLRSPAWTGGAADCTASLDVYTNHGWSVVTSTTFHVNA